MGGGGSVRGSGPAPRRTLPARIGVGRGAAVRRRPLRDSGPGEIDGRSRQDPAYRPAQERPREGPLLLPEAGRRRVSVLAFANVPPTSAESSPHIARSGGPTCWGESPASAA